jgi:hypothetical protein
VLTSYSRSFECPNRNATFDKKNRGEIVTLGCSFLVLALEQEGSSQNSL